jgi:hypothetical protein
MKKSGKEFALMLSISAEHLSRIEHDQKPLSGSHDALIRALYTICVCEGEKIPKGAFDALSKERDEHKAPCRRIELTPSDWLMQREARCAAA